MDPSQPPQDSPAPQQPQQGWPAPGQGPVPGPYGGPGPGPYAAPGPYTSPPPGPYGPYGPQGPGGAGPYGAPQPGTNGMAVASFVAGIVCCLPPLGLVFGLIALPQIRKKQQKGKGFAITGIVLSTVSCLLITLGLATGGLTDAWRDFKRGMDEAAASKSTFSLRKGECFNVPGKMESYTDDVDIVDCEKPHEGEVTGSFKVTGFTKWPGEDPLDDLAEERCRQINDAYALDTWAVPENVWTYYYLPSSQSWRTGDRTVTCAYATDKGPFSGSLRSDATTLTADQLFFLQQVNPIDDAMVAEPEEDPDVDLDGNKAWALKVHQSVTKAGGALRGHTWPGAASAPVAALVKKLDAVAPKWQKLATAKDEDAFWELYDEAYDELSADIEAPSRSALGLTGSLAGGSQKV
ncbi:DUF4190 domain-containing protein [Streptomyces sp. NPDC085481]|uniref:DUF4190 domain-containing protein n=1 Tax=Streptomyces sp. NPDC085481 TaxID=3365727 RepID=UPI0037D66BB5